MTDEPLAYQLFEMDGSLVGGGYLTSGFDINKSFFEHGSVSITLSDGRILSFLTSEWGSIYLDTKPITHQT